MIVVLKLFGGWLSGLLRSHAAREAEVVARLRLRTADRRRLQLHLPAVTLRS
jgi:hypothetical protein